MEENKNHHTDEKLEKELEQLKDEIQQSNLNGHKYDLIINGHKFQTDSRFITGKEILELTGLLPADDFEILHINLFGRTAHVVWRSPTYLMLLRMLTQ